uniref:Wsv303-like protein n=1 Tax=Sicyonia whispovirus TaxID=2984283 RepID=A0A9C7F7A2_9VIRU|nr:MAG: wsv303-like protein [Sicyonia whispovirus]
MGTERVYTEYEEGYRRHVLLGNVDVTQYSTDNNCISISIDFGLNAEGAPVTSASRVGGAWSGPTPFAKGAGPSPGLSHGPGDEACGGAACECWIAGAHDGGLSRLVGVPSKMVLSRERMMKSEKDTSQKQFTALKSRSSFYSVLKFETGAVIVVGLQDPALSKLCVTNVVTDIADTLEHPIKIRNVSIVNTVSTFNRFQLSFSRISSFFDRHNIAYIYNPETFPGMFFKIRVPSRPLEPGESLAEYYSKVASMHGRPDFRMGDYLRRKTALTFKVGKNTILGECGCGDVSTISKLLFGLFHYFMDHNIKMTAKELRTLRKRYGIPPLEWFLYTDILFHSAQYVKPTREEVERSINVEGFTSLDKTFYGNRSLAAMSANLLRPLEETAAVLRAMAAQKLGGPAALEAARRYRTSMQRSPLVGFSARVRLRQALRCGPADPFAMARLVPPSDNLAEGMNGRISSAGASRTWWLDKPEFATERDILVDLCNAELVVKSEAAGMVVPAFLRGYALSAAQEKLARAFAVAAPAPTHDFAGSESSNQCFRASGKFKAAQVTRERDTHRLTLARLETLTAANRFIGKNLFSGRAPELASLLNTNVYSLMHLVKNLPKTRGQILADEESGQSGNRQVAAATFRTPGDAYFSSILDETPGEAPTFGKRQHSQNYWQQKQRGPRRKRPRLEEASALSCECGAAFVKGSAGVVRGFCDACEAHGTWDVENALSDIWKDKATKKQEGNKCTASDFISAVGKYTDEHTGALKISLEFKVGEILKSMCSRRGMEDRPTANYRTSLHTDTQKKSNMEDLLVRAFQENGASEEDTAAFKVVLASEGGLMNLCELVKKKKRAESRDCGAAPLSVRIT